MNRSNRLAKAVRRNTRGSSGFVYGTWVGAEAVDPNLSRVLIPGAGLDGQPAEHRFVPKGAHVTGLTANARVLCGGSPLCILAVVVGDTSLANI